MEGLLPRASSEKDGLFNKNNYNITVPVNSYSNSLSKIVLTYPEGTVDGYAHFLLLIETTLFKLNYYSDSRDCTVSRLFGSMDVKFYANKEKHEIYLTNAGMISLKVFNAPAEMKFSMEIFKDGETLPTEEDGILMKNW